MSETLTECGTLHVLPFKDQRVSISHIGDNYDDYDDDDYDYDDDDDDDAKTWVITVTVMIIITMTITTTTNSIVSCAWRQSQPVPSKVTEDSPIKNDPQK